MIDHTHTAILKTKITLPNPKDSLIPRSRLLDSLTEGQHGRLTFVSAPAGFGKTTLLTQWAHVCQIPCAWLALDELDNDTIRFWRYLAHAAAPVLPDSNRERILSLAQAMPNLSMYTFLDSFLNELFTLPERIVILLDDVHVIHDRRIHESLAYFIDYLPQGVHMILSSRSELPFSVAKWIAHNEHNGLDMQQMQFTIEETEQFCTSTAGIRLSSRQIEQLRLRTEGWAAGLQLVSHSLRSETNYDRYISEMNGDHRDVADFLFHEVIDKLPAELYPFLLDTSVFAKMNAPIADMATGRSNSQLLLEEVKRLNLFLVPLDDRNMWFRYHHLFAQFLQGLVKRNDPQQWLRANRLASKSFAAHGLMDEAIHHALEAQDMNLVHTYMTAYIPEVLHRGEHDTVLHWFRRLPTEAVLTPELSLLYAFVLVLTGELQEADRLLDEVERIGAASNEPNRNGKLQSGILFVRSNLMFLSGNFEKWFAFVEGSVDQILPEDAMFYNYNYNLTEPLVRRMPLGLKGVLSDATEAIGRMFTGILESRGWAQSLITLYVKQSMCEGYYEWNQLDRSHELLGEVEHACMSMQVPGLSIPLAITQARLYVADNRLHLAHDCIQNAIQATTDDRWLRLLQAFQIRLYLHDGQAALAKKTANKLGLTAKDKPSFDQEYMYLAFVRLLGKQRKEREALRLLELMKPQAEREQLISSIVEISILQALLEDQRGWRDSALLPLHDALTLGHQNGYIRSFLDEGSAMKALLKHYLQIQMTEPAKLPATDTISEYARKLLGLFPCDEKPQVSHVSALAEPLSHSELNLLRLLKQGATNKEIAAELALSPGTVRVYLSRVYEKLAVSSRTQALHAVQELRLLE